MPGSRAKDRRSARAFVVIVVVAVSVTEAWLVTVRVGFTVRREGAEGPFLFRGIPHF